MYLKLVTSILNFADCIVNFECQRQTTSLARVFSASEASPGPRATTTSMETPTAIRNFDSIPAACRYATSHVYVSADLARASEYPLHPS